MYIGKFNYKLTGKNDVKRYVLNGREFQIRMDSRFDKGRNPRHRISPEEVHYVVSENGDELFRTSDEGNAFAFILSLFEKGKGKKEADSGIMRKCPKGAAWCGTKIIINMSEDGLSVICPNNTCDGCTNRNACIQSGD